MSFIRGASKTSSMDAACESGTLVSISVEASTLPSSVCCFVARKDGNTNGDVNFNAPKDGFSPKAEKLLAVIVKAITMHVNFIVEINTVTVLTGKKKK